MNILKNYLLFLHVVELFMNVLWEVSFVEESFLRSVVEFPWMCCRIISRRPACARMRWTR